MLERDDSPLTITISLNHLHQQLNFYAMDIRELLKNPFFVFVAGLLAILVIFKLLNIFLSLSWLFVLGFIVLFIINERFRETVQAFFRGLFNR